MASVALLAKPLKVCLRSFSNSVFRKGGVHEHVRHDVEQGLAVFDEAAAIHAKSGGAEAGSDAVDCFVDLGLAARGGSSAHERACHAGIAGASAFVDGVYIEGEPVAYAWELVVLYYDEGQPIFERFHGVVAQNDFRCWSRLGCLRPVYLGTQHEGNEGRERDHEGSKTVHCAFSFMK